MSCSLHARPVPSESESPGGSQLRDAIEAEFGLPCELDANAEMFLRGLAAANVQGARRLLNMLSEAESGRIALWKEC